MLSFWILLRLSTKFLTLSFATKYCIMEAMVNCYHGFNTTCLIDINFSVVWIDHLVERFQFFQVIHKELYWHHCLYY